MNAISLLGNHIAQSLLPQCADAPLENMILELRNLQILAEYLAYGLFVLALHEMSEELEVRSQELNVPWLTVKSL